MTRIDRMSDEFRRIKELNAWKGPRWATRKQFKLMASRFHRQEREMYARIDQRAQAVCK